MRVILDDYSAHTAQIKQKHGIIERDCYNRPKNEESKALQCPLEKEKLVEEASETNLKRIRITYGFTQAELARRSSVSLRSIQMYEQRNKNINKASADTMYRLAKILGCTMEDLIEK